MTIALVVGVHRHRAIAEHGLGPGGGDHKVSVAIRDRVADVPQEAVFFLRDHFQIGDRGVQHGIPVDQAFAAVDQSFVVKTHEGLAHRPGQPLVHGEALAGPVHRGAHAAQLPGDGSAGMILPLPHAAQKLLPADVLPGESLAIELTLDDDLRRDTRVVHSCLPERVVALHAVVADQCVHDGVLEGVTHVQTSGDVRRRDHDAVGTPVAARLEVAVFLPGLVPGLFDRQWVVGLIHSVLDKFSIASAWLLSMPVYSGYCNRLARKIEPRAIDRVAEAVDGGGRSGDSLNRPGGVRARIALRESPEA